MRHSAMELKCVWNKSVCLVTTVLLLTGKKNAFEILVSCIFTGKLFVCQSSALSNHTHKHSRTLNGEHTDYGLFHKPITDKDI